MRAKYKQSPRAYTQQYEGDVHRLNELVTLAYDASLKGDEVNLPDDLSEREQKSIWAGVYARRKALGTRAPKRYARAKKAPARQKDKPGPVSKKDSKPMQNHIRLCVGHLRGRADFPRPNPHLTTKQNKYAWAMAYKRVPEAERKKWVEPAAHDRDTSRSLNRQIRAERAPVFNPSFIIRKKREEEGCTI